MMRPNQKENNSMTMSGYEGDHTMTFCSASPEVQRKLNDKQQYMNQLQAQKSPDEHQRTLDARNAQRIDEPDVKSRKPDTIHGSNNSPDDNANDTHQN